MENEALIAQQESSSIEDDLRMLVLSHQTGRVFPDLKPIKRRVPTQSFPIASDNGAGRKDSEKVN
jgi:hypothetical protein